MKLLELLIYQTALTTACEAYSPISLTTTTILPKSSPEELHRFLSSPGNWPKIVASSHSVESPSGMDLDLNQPLKVGDVVDEIFGLPPILPLSVQWKCVKSIQPTSQKDGLLDFISQDGVPGIASECQMLFKFKKQKDAKGNLVPFLCLQMEYKPESPIALLAAPILVADNALALNILLPSALEKDSSKKSSIDDFRSLMGSLYGIAGVAHLVDSLLSSQLLTSAGSPPFNSLPPLGQGLVLIWCFMGFVSFAFSRIGGFAADLGLILYGFVEMSCAGIIRFRGDAIVGSLDPLTNAIMVQAIVALAWLYSAKKDDL